MSALAIDVAALIACVGDVGHGGTAVVVHVGDGSAWGDAPDVAAALALAAARFGARCEVAWRGGRVPAGEPAFAVAAAAAHRTEAFAACRLVAAALAGA